jgi:flagellar protein FliL
VATPPADAAPAPAKSRGLKVVVLVLVCLLCTAAGAAVPWLTNASPFGPKDPAAPAGHGKPAARDDKTVTVPFGDVVVNLNEERMSRYLRVKIVLAVEEKQEKPFTDHLNKARAQLKSWLIGHLSGKSLKEVGGTVGVKRLQREIMERFEEVLYPDGDGPLREVLFEEYDVQ